MWMWFLGIMGIGWAVMSWGYVGLGLFLQQELLSKQMWTRGGGKQFSLSTGRRWYV